MKKQIKGKAQSASDVGLNLGGPGKGGLQMKLAEWPGSLAEDWMNHRAIGGHANRKLLTGNLVQCN